MTRHSTTPHSSLGARERLPLVLRKKKEKLKQLPIYSVDFSDPEEIVRHDRMVELVKWMLELHERLAEAKVERERTVLGHQIAATDRQIDRLVYDLYGLTDEEVAIVERDG